MLTFALGDQALCARIGIPWLWRPGDKDATLRYLQETADIHESPVRGLGVEPAFYWLPADPRFINPEKRLGLPLP